MSTNLSAICHDKLVNLLENLIVAVSRSNGKMGFTCNITNVSIEMSRDEGICHCVQNGCDCVNGAEYLIMKICLHAQCMMIDGHWSSLVNPIASTALLLTSSLHCLSQRAFNFSLVIFRSVWSAYQLLTVEAVVPLYT